MFVPFNQLLEEEYEKDPKWHSGFEWDEEIEKANREIFHNDNFRIKQREIINATKSGRDVIALIPTGGGKSLTFQLPATTEDGCSLIVMPLISLIEDQISQMNELGISC